MERPLCRTNRYFFIITTNITIVRFIYLHLVYCCETDKCVDPANFCKWGVIDRGLDKWQWQVAKIKYQVFIEHIIHKRCALLLLYNVCVISVVLKVGAVECHRLGCLLVLDDSITKRYGWSRGWSQCLVQIVGVNVWSDNRCSWRRSKMWTQMS